MIEFWTIQFEKVVHSAGNFKNILHSLATRHQLMLAYYLEIPSIFKPSIEMGRVSVMSVDILDAAIRKAIWDEFKGLDSVSLTSIASANGTTYLKDWCCQ